MSGMGTAMMGTGEASGDRRAVVAAEEAIANPLLDDVSLKGARGLLLSIIGGRDLTLYEVDEAASRVRQEVDPEANIIVGASFDEAWTTGCASSIVASGMAPATNGCMRRRAGPMPAAADAAHAAETWRRRQLPARRLRCVGQPTQSGFRAPPSRRRRRPLPPVGGGSTMDAPAARGIGPSIWPGQRRVQIPARPSPPDRTRLHDAHTLRPQPHGTTTSRIAPGDVILARGRRRSLDRPSAECPTSRISHRSPSASTAPGPTDYRRRSRLPDRASTRTAAPSSRAPRKRALFERLTGSGPAVTAANPAHVTVTYPQARPQPPLQAWRRRNVVGRGASSAGVKNARPAMPAKTVELPVFFNEERK